VEGRGKGRGKEGRERKGKGKGEGREGQWKVLWICSPGKFPSYATENKTLNSL